MNQHLATTYNLQPLTYYGPYVLLLFSLEPLHAIQELVSSSRCSHGKLKSQWVFSVRGVNGWVLTVCLCVCKFVYSCPHVCLHVCISVCVCMAVIDQIQGVSGGWLVCIYISDSDTIQPERVYWSSSLRLALISLKTHNSHTEQQGSLNLSQ